MALLTSVLYWDGFKNKHHQRSLELKIKQNVEQKIKEQERLENKIDVLNCVS